MAEREIREIIRSLCERLDRTVMRPVVKAAVPMALGAGLAMSPGCTKDEAVAVYMAPDVVETDVPPADNVEQDIVPPGDMAYMAPDAVEDPGLVPEYMAPDAVEPDAGILYMAPDSAYMAPDVAPAYMGPDAAIDEGPQVEYMGPDAVVDAGPQTDYMAPDAGIDAGPQMEYMAPD
jgi:hypothetical protein